MQVYPTGESDDVLIFEADQIDYDQSILYFAAYLIVLSFVTTAILTFVVGGLTVLVTGFVHAFINHSFNNRGGGGD